MDLYWFMPALAKSNVGSSWGTTDEGQCVCAWRWKYSTKVLRILLGPAFRRVGDALSEAHRFRLGFELRRHGCLLALLGLQCAGD